MGERLEVSPCAVEPPSASHALHFAEANDEAMNPEPIRWRIERPAEIEFLPGKPEWCYWNALTLSSKRPEWHYAEGAVLALYGMIIRHAWCVVAESNRVAECTLRPEQLVYPTLFCGWSFSRSERDQQQRDRPAGCWLLPGDQAARCIAIVRDWRDAGGAKP